VPKQDVHQDEQVKKTLKDDLNLLLELEDFKWRQRAKEG
jgi:hypothetical protein